jgi:hypothetical protein
MMDSVMMVLSARNIHNQALNVIAIALNSDGTRVLFAAVSLRATTSRGMYKRLDTRPITERSAN